MDEFQIFLSILIPLGVSLFAWTLTYIIPYIFPKFVSNSIIKVTRSYPKNPIEIGLIINQFSKYDDWKRLTAYKKIKKMFIWKIREIEEIEEANWVELKTNVINMPLDALLDKLNIVLLALADDEYEEKHSIILSSGDVKKHFKEKIDTLEKNQSRYSEFLKNHPNAIIWNKLTLHSKFIEKYNKGNYILTIEEIEFIKSKYTMLDKDGTMTIEEFLELKNHHKPEKKSNEEILTTFNDVILYIDYPHSKREELIYRLALGLSDHELSRETLINIIKEAKGEIFQKDYKKWKKRMNIR